MTSKQTLTFPRLSFDRRTFLKTAAGTAALTMTGALAAAVAHAQGGLIALVHTQAAGDAGPVDSMIAKLKQLAEEKGLEHRAIYAQDPATYETIFRTLGDAGAAVVVSTFNEVAEPFKAVAPSYPDTKWIQLFGDPFEPAIPNVVTVSYDYYLGCYLSGIFAGRISKTGKIGFIGGISIPPLNADFNALKAGVLSVRPDATVTAAFAGSFQDPAKGQEIATQMFSDGIDYIQTDAAATDFGIIAAANEGPGRYVSALDPAQFKLGPKSLISIVGLDFGVSLYNEATKAVDGDWTGGSHVNTGLGTGVIEFMLSPLFQDEGDPDMVARSKEVWAEIEKAKAGILDGSIEVPFNTTL
ncbi:BMP family ABC transporter substrate-binding protein [Aquibium carbonis]|uniref:BMP family ABC transporter substrate-binding protein n=1 Tax=Aquibium carbonis TaxID=2495581 RepID=A0A429Z1W0_9HYPH|nr:BMP family ABC transporter substrate-binding protein [Aquibium carbonis]RST87687.1 BMP family ABC transporter substrate-binding protein [Aquibium carbonis]